MTYARPKRNYRVAQKQVEQNNRALKGTFVPEKDKPKVALFAVGIGVLLFVLGLLIGALANRD
ncbi:MAG: hypothetical protein IJS61_00555 [Firmicutes bacterium]|nr:hypothetical protein [Bacillota bacterium]